MSTSLFLALPAPLKIVIIIVGGFFFVGHKHQANRAQVAGGGAEQQVPHAKVAEVAPAKPVAPDEKKAVAVKPLKLIVNSDGSYQLEGKKLTGQELAGKLKAEAAVNPKRVIELRASALTPHQMVANAVKMCGEAGLANLNFISEPAAP